MAVNMNLKSTTNPSFGIGKRGVTIYQGTALPDVAVGLDGDVYVRSGTSAELYQKVSGAWKRIQLVNANLTDVSSLPLTNNSFLGTNGSNIVSRTLAETQSILGLGSAAYLNAGTNAGNVPVLDAQGKLLPGVIPSLAITDIFVVTDDTSRDALSVQKGDVAVVTSTGTNYIYDGAAWIAITKPDSVSSVAGKTGAVVLSTDDLASGTLSVQRGGTGFNAYATGDILVASDSATLSRLAKGSNGQILGVSSNNVGWVNLNASDVVVTPNGDQRISSTNVQDALVEIAQERSYTHISTVNPSYAHDNNDTAAIGVKFKQGDAWLNVSTNMFYYAAAVTTNSAVWVPATNAGIFNIVEDLTPELGGDLDVNGKKIVSSNNGNINLAPHGTGQVIVDGKSFPKGSGTGGQLIKTDGNGSLYWADDLGEANTYSSLGVELDGEAIIGTKTGIDLPFKRIKAGTNINVTSTENSVEISSNDPTTASNLGTVGTRILSGKVGSDFQFRRLTNGANITLTENSNDIQIEVSGLSTIATSGVITDATGDLPAARVSGLSDVATSGSYDDLVGKPTLGTVASLDVGTAPGNVPVLDGNGKLVTSILPAVAITDVHVVADDVARDALTVQTGDVAKVTSTGKTFIYDGATWVEVSTPDAVNSVNTKIGNVVLDATDLEAVYTATNYTSTGTTVKDQFAGIDAKLITLGTASSFLDLTDSVDYTATDANKVVKVNGDGTGIEFGVVLSTVASTNSYLDLDNKPFIPDALGDLSTVTLTTPANKDFLKFNGTNWVNAQVDYNEIINTPIFATVATSGDYSDLSNRPSLSTVATTGNIDDTTGNINVSRVTGLATVATSGSYSDLSDKPSFTSALSALTDVTVGALADGHVLRYDGATSKWNNKQLSYNDLADKPTFTSALASLTDVTITSPVLDQVLKYDGSKWINATNTATGDKIETGTTNVKTAEVANTITVNASGKRVAEFVAGTSTGGEKFVVKNGDVVGQVRLEAKNATGTGDVDIVLLPQNNGNIKLGENSSDAKIQPDATYKLTIKSGNGSGSTNANALYLEGGDGATGNLNGGDVVIKGGTKAGTGADGKVIINGVTYPSTDGVAGQAIVTNGAGVATWANVSADTSTFKNVLVITTGTADTLTNAHHLVIVNKAVNGTHTINLPAGASVGVGKTYTIKDGKGNSSNYMIAIYANGSETIDGNSGIGINANYDSVTVVWNGTQWNII